MLSLALFLLFSTERSLFLSDKRKKMYALKILFFVVLTLFIENNSFGQREPLLEPKISLDSTKKEPERKWFTSFSIRGYVQVRYNNLAMKNANLGCEQCDKFWGGDPSFSLRRARIVFSGQIHPQIYFYIQPDFASGINEAKNFVQLRDAYFDIGVDKKSEFRFRIGQSKVPYGFENLQSSGIRLSLDRNDAINSAFTNERDIGLSFMWAPTKRRALFRDLVSMGLKGSGDYGVIAFGVINGQPLNTKELNKNKHVFIRGTYPFNLKNQTFEASIQAYTGLYHMQPDDVSVGVKHNSTLNYRDERVGVSAIWYPKPFGIQAEYNIGRGPEFDKSTDSITTKQLSGGYVLLNYQFKIKKQLLIPFAKYKYYDGGKKFEQDARSYHMNEVEFGIEWQPLRYFELVVMYTLSERRYEDYILRDNLQRGNSLRIQAQLNF